MKIIATLLIVLVFPLCGFADSSSDIDRFLASRSVVGQVYFAVKTSQLSAASKSQLKELVPLLKAQQRSGRLLRVEGFASKDGQVKSNIDLSMERALEVKNFLRQHDLSVELFLTGYGANSAATGKLSEQRRVDITSYTKNSSVAEFL